jgi:multiple sugar transport system substrate-binding protein
MRNCEEIMTQINLSFASHWIPEQQARFAQIIDTLQSQSASQLQTEFIDWSDMWTRLSAIATDKNGPLMSEVGSTWVGSFYGENALKTFSDADIDAIGGRDAFLAWEIGSPVNSLNPVSIPWMADSQVMFYWKDIFDEASIDPDGAFRTISNFEDALSRLSLHRLKYPWATGTTRFPANLHQLASWIWGVGGDLLDESGQNIRLLEDEAILATSKYFALHRYIPEYRTTSPIEMARHFAHREAAVTMGGIKVYNQIKNHLSEDDLRNVGVSLPSGIPFVGCESLVIWSHTPHQLYPEILQFINQLMSPTLQLQIADLLDLIPTRIDVLSQPPYNTDPVLRMLTRAVSIGRSYPAIPVWGIVENQLLDTIGAIWEDIFAEKNPDVDNIVRKHFVRLSQLIRSII